MFETLVLLKRKTLDLQHDDIFNVLSGNFI